MAQMPPQGNQTVGATVFLPLTLADIANHISRSSCAWMQPPECFYSLASDNPPAWLLALERKQGPPPQRSKGYGWAGHRRLPEGRGLHLGLERRIWITERKREAFPVSGAV